MSHVVFARVARRAGTAVTLAMLALAAPVLADSNPPGSGGSSMSGGGGDANGGSGSEGGSAGGGGCKSGGDSRHLGDRVLCQGMHGHDVRVLQAYLSDAGFPTSMDGGFGAGTKQSVLVFQRSRGMSPNGVVTVHVEEALRQVVGAVQASPPTGTTRINADGSATAPSGAPASVQAVVSAANQILNTSYCVGGGHGSWNSGCYDCSGAVSFALHGAGLLSSPQDSTGLESYGDPGPGRWITIYANAGHTWIVVAGRAFDTADYGGPNIPSGDGPRWRSNPTGNLGDGGSYVERHPRGL